MTLIAAFRCGTPDDPGVVVCADSQETYGHYRVTVEKIKPRAAGQYDLIVGGAGNTGVLIDGLADAIERNVSHWPFGLDEESGRQRLESVLLAYHSRQVALYPAPDEDKILSFIVCVRDKQSTKIHLWKTEGTAATAIGDYALIGWDEAIYKHQVKQFYRPSLSLSQSVLLAIDLLSVAKKTSNYVGGPTQIIVARNAGMWVDSPEDVSKLEERIERFNAQLGRLVLASLDVSMPDADFEKIFKRFETQINLLRRTYAQDAVIHSHRSAPAQTTEDDWQGFPYPKYSFDALVDLLYGGKRIQRAITEANEAVKEADAAEIERDQARARAKEPRKQYEVKVEWIPIPKEILDPTEPGDEAE